MPMELKKYGLLGTPEDLRDFPVHLLAGSAHPLTLPREFHVSTPIVIKDQGPDTDMCGAYALTSVAEDEDGVILDPLYSFARTRQIMGSKPDEWGTDLRSECQSAVKFGFRRGDVEEVSLPSNMAKRNAALGAFPKSEDVAAAQFKKRSFWAVTGPHDFFDNVRSAIWQNRAESRSVLTGVDWRPEWTAAKSGVVDEIGGGQGYGHAVKAFGWDGDRLTLQLSNGSRIGEGGIFHLSREVVNKAFVYGGFTLLDLPKEEALYQLGRIGCLSYWYKSIFS